LVETRKADKLAAARVNRIGAGGAVAAEQQRGRATHNKTPAPKRPCIAQTPVGEAERHNLIQRRGGQKAKPKVAKSWNSRLWADPLEANHPAAARWPGQGG
jgi:hypothetical protein